MQTAFAFDFDGTITDVPGERSRLFSLGAGLRGINDLSIVYARIQNVVNEYFPPNLTARLRNFFEIIHAVGGILTLHTNNYYNVVVACLSCHIGVPLEYFDLTRSSFRENGDLKFETLEKLSQDPNIGRIYFFEDTWAYINSAKQLPKVVPVYCRKGEHSLNRLLEIVPVNDSVSLNEFLRIHTT